MSRLLATPSADAVPYLQMDGRDGKFSFGEGQEKATVDLTGAPLFVDVVGAVQGWLAVGAGGADWRPLNGADAWGAAPSHDHKPAVAVMVTSEKAFGSDKAYRFRGNSAAHYRFVQDVYDKTIVEAKKGNKIPVIRITGTSVRKVGAGSSIDVQFEVGPFDLWADRPADAPDTVAATASPPEIEGGEPDSWG